MTSTNPTEAECCDLSTEDGGTHDSTQTTHERADTHPAGTGKEASGTAHNGARPGYY